jgi:hypothetical protein
MSFLLKTFISILLQYFKKLKIFKKKKKKKTYLMEGFDHDCSSHFVEMAMFHCGCKDLKKKWL